MLSATNSIRCGKYVFQPTEYDENDDLHCVIVRRYKYKKIVNDKIKLTGIYHFDTDTFEIIHTSPDWFNHNHQKMLKWFLKQYDWCIK